MALSHKWDVKNDFAYVLQFFPLIFDGLGSVTFWGLRDSKGPILMHQAHLFKINDIDPERRFVNLFAKFSPFCAAAQRAEFAKKVHKPPLRVNVINFELN